MVEAVSWCRGEHCSPVSFPTQLRDKTKLCRSQNGTSRAPSPTIVSYILLPQNRYALCGFYFVYGYRKAVQRFVLRHRFIISFTVVCFFYFSAPLGRLTPIEALPISCERSRTRNLLRKGLCPLTLQAL